MKYEGYIEPKIEEKDYIFGDAQAPEEVLEPDGQWTKYLPDREPQLKQIETYNCTSFGTLNALEILLRRRGFNYNFSDRYLGIKAGTKPPGNTPQAPAEAIRKSGSISEGLLPYTDDLTSWQEYYSYKGGDERVCNEVGTNFVGNYVFRHDYLPRVNGAVTPSILKEALTQSPLGIAVQAWVQEGDKYVRKGEDTHWTCLVGYEDNKHWLVFDSYEPYLKKLDWNFGFVIAKRYYIREKTEEEKLLEKEQLSAIQSLINTIGEYIKILAQTIAKIVTAKEPISLPPVEEPKIDKVGEWAKQIELCEGYGTEGAVTITKYFNPGAIKAFDGRFIKFTTYEQGFEYLKLYLIRAATGHHKAYPLGGETSLWDFTQIYVGDDHNYARKVASGLKVDVHTAIKNLI